jgi:ABC-type transporter Mla subunit MlaD
MNQKDLAKVLAVCIVHIDRKIARLQESIPDVAIPAVELSEEISESSNAPEFKLPDGIIFEAHLEEALDATRSELQSFKQSLAETIDGIVIDSVAQRDSLLEQLEAVNRSVASLSEEDTSLATLIEQVNSYAKTGFEDTSKEITQVYEKFDSVNELIDHVKEELVRTDSYAKSGFEDASKEIVEVYQKFDSVSELIEQHRSMVVLKEEELECTIQAVKEELEEKARSSQEAITEAFGSSL